MKKIYLTIAVLMVAGLVIAASTPRLVPGNYTFTNITTNGTDSVTSTGPVLNGWLDAIKIDLSGASSPTGTITVATTGSGGSGEATTLYSAEVTADTIVYPRALTVTVDGLGNTNLTQALIPVVAEHITVSYTDMNVTNVNSEVFVTLK